MKRLVIKRHPSMVQQMAKASINRVRRAMAAYFRQDSLAARMSQSELKAGITDAGLSRVVQWVLFGEARS